MKKKKSLELNPKIYAEVSPFDTNLEEVNIPKEILEYTLTKDQKRAFELIYAFVKGEYKTQDGVLRVGGLAGTGKSVLIQYTCLKLGLTSTNTMFVGYTGQSVNVLRKCGIPAKTIHSSFMVPVQSPLRDENGRKIVKNGIPVLDTKFIPINKISKNISLIIGDEWSFVSEDMEDMILKHKVPLITFGDPLQLPPVNGISRFTENSLDYLMTNIMRQERDSEIIDLSMRIREGDKIPTSKYIDNVRFIRAKDSTEETISYYKPYFSHSDMILTPTNKLRQEVTDIYRKLIVGTDYPYPLEGEPLICRKNNWNLLLCDIMPLTNGTRGVAISDVSLSSISGANKVYYIDFKPDYVADSNDNIYFDNLLCDSEFLMLPFGHKDAIIKYQPRTHCKKNKGRLYNSGAKLEFAYAISVNLSQGSQANNVLYMDKWIGDHEYMRRQRYTAVTRAKDFLVWIRPITDWS